MLGNEGTNKPIYGPAFFCTRHSVDVPFTDVTLATYQAFSDQGSQHRDVDRLARVLLSALPNGAARDQAQAVGIGASLPLVYKPCAWPFTKPPKALLFEYCQQSHLSELPKFRQEPNVPHERFLYSVAVHFHHSHHTDRVHINRWVRTGTGFGARV